LSAYVQIIIPHAWDKSHLTKWFSCVKQQVPDGMIVGTQLPHSDKNKSSSYYVKRTANNKYAYVVPLSRDLQPHEVHAILQAWCKTYPEGDFTLDYSQPLGIKPVTDAVTSDRWDEILNAWGKHQHVIWMQRHVADGWQYGVTLSTKHKTHPWIQPWESLPTSARQLNIQGVQDLMKILNDFGYQITQIPRS
jgi:hypothetical protein